MNDSTILHLWDTHVGDPTTERPFTDADKKAFARAVLAAHSRSLEGRQFDAESAWNSYAYRSGLLLNDLSKIDAARAQCAYYAYTAAWDSAIKAVRASCAE